MDHNYDSIIFDIDGTLWDSTDGIVYSWAETSKEHFDGSFHPTAAEVQAIMGKTWQEIAEAFAPQLGENTEAFFRIILKEETRWLNIYGGGTLFPGVTDTIRALSERYPLYVVSNCHRAYLECLMDRKQLRPYFSGDLCEGDTHLPKSGTLKTLKEKYGLKRPVYVGDTHGDELAAREAGYGFIHAAYGFGTAEAPDAVIGSITELTEMFLGEEKT